MAKQKKKSARSARKTGAIRVKSRKSAYSARPRTADVPRDADVTADIDAAVRQGEAIRADIERRIEAGLSGY